MDINTRLEDEIIFAKRPMAKKVITTLNNKGIYTVADFINCSIEQLSNNLYAKKQFRAFQKILRCKYLGEPLPPDITLSKEYPSKERIRMNLNKDMMNLGFGEYNFNHVAETILIQNGTCKIIDIIFRLNEKFDYLKEFYIQYYNTEVKNGIDDVHVITSEKNNLVELKRELENLLNQRKILDKRISFLLDQINSITESRPRNTRK